MPNRPTICCVNIAINYNSLPLKHLKVHFYGCKSQARKLPWNIISELERRVCYYNLAFYYFRLLQMVLGTGWWVVGGYGKGGPFVALFSEIGGHKMCITPALLPIWSKPNHARSPQNEAPADCYLLDPTSLVPTVLLSDPPSWFPVCYIGDLAGFDEQRMSLPGRPTSACNTCRRKKVKVSTA